MQIQIYCGHLDILDFLIMLAALSLQTGVEAQQTLRLLSQPPLSKTRNGL